MASLRLAELLSKFLVRQKTRIFTYRSNQNLPRQSIPNVFLIYHTLFCQNIMVKGFLIFEI
jgi:hypothetical protein